MTKDDIVYSKEFVYFLGFLWSDGFIERKRTILEILEEDALDIIEHIQKIDFLNIHRSMRTRKNRKPQMSIYFCDSKFYDIFQSKYFQNKSKCSPDSLLQDIPNDLVRFFYLGLIDGDGCFYHRGSTRQFYVTSSYEQIWNHMTTLFDKLKIYQFEIRRIENKNGNKSSYIRIKKHEEIKKLYQYLYPNGLEIGLKRKYDKCLSIINNPPKYISNKSKIDIIDLKEKVRVHKNIHKISEIYKCNWRKIHNFCKKHKLETPRNFYSNKESKKGI